MFFSAFLRHLCVPLQRTNATCPRVVLLHWVSHFCPIWLDGKRWDSTIVLKVYRCVPVLIKHHLPHPQWVAIGDHSGKIIAPCWIRVNHCDDWLINAPPPRLWLQQPFLSPTGLAAKWQQTLSPGPHLSTASFTANPSPPIITVLYKLGLRPVTLNQCILLFPLFSCLSFGSSCAEKGTAVQAFPIMDFFVKRQGNKKQI